MKRIRVPNDVPDVTSAPVTRPQKSLPPSIVTPDISVYDVPFTNSGEDRKRLEPETGKVNAIIDLESLPETA